MSGHGGGGGGKKKRRGGGHGGGGGHGDARFLVTYADLLTVLMALFLVLWVLATIDLNKFKKFTQGLGDFGNPAASVVSSPAEASPGETVPPDGSTEDTTPTAGSVTETTDASTDSTDASGAGAQGNGGNGTSELTSGQLQGVADRIQQELTGAQVPATATTIRMESRGLVVTVQTDGVLFGSGSATMTQAGKDILAVLAPELLAIGNNVVIEGHTDKRPLARVGYDNWNLSVDRAVSVLRVLKDDFGVPPDRLAATGYGEFRPVDTGTSEEALAKNRRVEIVILAKAVTPTPTSATTVAADGAPSESTTATAEPVTTAAG